MRLSRAGLLIAAAVSIPVILELRTLLALFGIDLPVEATVALVAAVIGALVLWRAYPALVDPEPE